MECGGRGVREIGEDVIHCNGFMGLWCELAVKLNSLVGLWVVVLEPLGGIGCAECVEICVDGAMNLVGEEAGEGEAINGCVGEGCMKVLVGGGRGDEMCCICNGDAVSWLAEEGMESGVVGPGSEGSRCVRCMWCEAWRNGGGVFR